MNRKVLVDSSPYNGKKKLNILTKNNKAQDGNKLSWWFGACG